MNTYKVIYHLVICYITMERSTIVHGKIHYFYGDFPVCYVKLPEGRSILVWFTRYMVGYYT